MNLTTNIDWSEDRLQQECYTLFHNALPDLRGMLFSVPNGGTRNIIEAKKMKETGLVPGVSDMIFLYNGRAYLLELKRPDGKNYQSKAQKIWQQKAEFQGFEYHIIKSKQKFWDIITRIIK